MTHWRSLALALNVAPIAGKPTLTTEPSTKARPDARIVAIKANVGWRGCPPDTDAFACAASQDVWMETFMTRRMLSIFDLRVSWPPRFGLCHGRAPQRALMRGSPARLEL